MTSYRPSQVFEAVQWSGSNWHEVYALAGHHIWVVNENELRVRVSDEIAQIVTPGMWLAKMGDDDFQVFDDVKFNEMFEETEAV